MNHIKQSYNLSGKLSIVLSSICVVHCLATPVILITLPAVSMFFSETIEQFIVLSVIPMSLVGFIPTWLRHKDYRLLGFYTFSIILIVFSQFLLHVSHDALIQGNIPAAAWLRVGFTFAGVFILAWTVFNNNRHTHYCTHPNHHQDKARPRPDAPLTSDLKSDLSPDSDNYRNERSTGRKEVFIMHHNPEEEQEVKDQSTSKKRSIP
ncbi:MAG: MerC domain-containing protein [Balneolales bacterium]